MNRLLYVASVAHLLFLSQLGEAYAEGAFDGEWSGFAISTAPQCKPGVVTMTIVGQVVVGQAKFEVDAPSIRGTVWDDGKFGATIGFQHLTGQFLEDKFAGTFKNFDCVWKMFLTRMRLPPETGAITADVSEPDHNQARTHLLW